MQNLCPRVVVLAIIASAAAQSCATAAPEPTGSESSALTPTTHADQDPNASAAPVSGAPDNRHDSSRRVDSLSAQGESDAGAIPMSVGPAMSARSGAILVPQADAGVSPVATQTSMTPSVCEADAWRSNNCSPGDTFFHCPARAQWPASMTCTQLVHRNFRMPGAFLCCH